MNPLYWLQDPAEIAESPRRWSYSSLTSWDDCPRRWWLLHSRYGNTPDGSYPVAVGAATLQGRLVHDALEANRRSERDADRRSRFDARKFIKHRLRELLGGEMAANPRIETGRLLSAFSIDQCLARYYSLVEPVYPATSQVSASPAMAMATNYAPEEAEELWIEVEMPPIAGRIDRVRRGIISDFKSGEPDPERHEAQLRFYATLWWLRYHQAPQGLELRYPNDTRQIQGPSREALQADVDRLRAAITTVVDLLDRPPPPARPTLEKCQYCPVRQLCPEYWGSTITTPLRQPTASDATEGVSLFRDVRITALPEGWTPGKALVGQVTAEGFGRLGISLEGRLCPAVGEEFPSEARLLNVLLLYRDGAWNLRSVVSSEAFWSR